MEPTLFGRVSPNLDCGACETSAIQPIENLYISRGTSLSKDKHLQSMVKNLAKLTSEKGIRYTS